MLTNGELEKGFNNAKKILRPKLIDHLNYINFSEEEILIVFKHSKYSKYDEIVTRVVKPGPCPGETAFGL